MITYVTSYTRFDLLHCNQNILLMIERIFRETLLYHDHSEKKYSCLLKLYLGREGCHEELRAFECKSILYHK